MWLAPILHLLALGAAEQPAPLAASAAPAPIYWRQTLFSIPFHVERPDRSSAEPVEVQLHVSPDRGVHWDNWRQAAPQKGYFLFRAGADGEYWFDVRTLDRAGQVHPQGPHSAKLVVIVDTLPPKVQLSAVRGDSGQITASFRIEELYPKLESLAIDYRLGANAAWQAVSVGPKDVRSNNSEHSGEVTWFPPNATGAIEIRLRISDMAGNPGESHANILPAAAPNPVRPGPGSNAALPPGVNPLGPWSPVAAATTTTASTAPATALSSSTTQAANRWQPLGSQTGTTPWPAENAGRSASDVNRPPAGESNPGNSSGDVRVNPQVSHQFVSEQRPALPAPVNPFNAFTASRPAETVSSPAANVGPPPGVALRWINTRVFQISYDTRGMGGPAGVSVELWGTRDGGKSWQSFRTDPKGQSPMLVNVPEEGVYGFRMTVQNGPGMAGRPPLPGDTPGFWVGIDLTRPVGRITQAQQGNGRDGDKLLVAWEASDNRELAARPISLAYSERLGGPWTTIAADLENSGRFTWQLNSSLPQRVYLRLEIHDAAGNMGIYETPEPVPLELSSPAAQIRDVHPLGRSDSSPVDHIDLR